MISKQRFIRIKNVKRGLTEMKKNIKKIAAFMLAVIMVFGLMGVVTYASELDPVVTVYITKTNFSAGGYDFEHGEYIPSEYQGLSDTPADSTKFSDDLFAVEVHLNQINTTSTRAVYDSTYSGALNALDVIIAALQSKGKNVYGGWDTYNDGGYITGFDGDGSSNYSYYEMYYDDFSESWFRHYTGMNWQFAYNTVEDGILTESNVYGTSVTNLFDGMHIVFDLSFYNMFYPAPVS